MPDLRVQSRTSFGLRHFLFAFTVAVQGCAGADDAAPTECTAELDTVEQAYTGNVQANANPLSFWWYASASEYQSAVREAIECAVQRLRAATCLPFDVSVDAHHWVRMRALDAMPNAWAHIGGSWRSSRIQIREDAPACDVLIHEIGQHLLRRSNEHVHPARPADGLHEALLTEVCSRNECSCFNPEPPKETP